MRTNLLLIFIVLIFTLFGCSADVNPTHSEINVKQGNTDIPCSSGNFDFGNLPIGLSQTITFTIENTGIHDLLLFNNPPVIITGTNKDDFIVLTNNTDSKINPGNSTAFKISFIPTEIGQRSATIEIANDDRDENPYTFSISGNCTQVAPEIHIMQDTDDILNNTGVFDFGMINVDVLSSPVIFTIQNNGNKKLNLTGSPNKIKISGVDESMFVVDDSSTRTSILSNDSTTFRVFFYPSSSGLKKATISIPNDDSDENPYTFSIQGTGVAVPEINVMKGSTNIINGLWKYGFENTLINESSIEVEFTIQNSGTAPLHISNIELADYDAAMFTLNKTATKETIQPGESTTFGLSFTPSSPGDKSATVLISNNDTDDNPFIFTIEGKCIEPEINIVQESTSIPHSTGTYDFGTIIEGNSSTEVGFTIQNIGAGDLKLTGSPKIDVIGSDASMFIVNQTNVISPIPYSNSTTFTVKFSPTSAGQKSATVSIANNDYDENPYTFTVKGEGEAAIAEINIKQGTVDVLCTTGSVTLGNVYVGYSGNEITLTIESKGNIDLELNGTPKIDVIGTNASMFEINQSMTDPSIAPNNTTTFGIKFKPTSTGNKSATVSIANNDSDENPYTFSVIGVGIQPVPEINVKQGSNTILNSSGTYDFGLIELGSSSGDFVFTVENIGTANLVLNGSSKIQISGTDSSMFSLNQSMTLSSVSPSSSTEFTIIFTPTSLGQKSALISITNNDSDENPYTFTITGTGAIIGPGDSIGWIGGGGSGWSVSNSPSYGPEYDKFYRAYGVFVDLNDILYVVDYSYSRISKWDSTGKAIGWIGAGSNGWKTSSAVSSGSDYKSFKSPMGVFVDSQGYIYVADTDNHRICKWDSAGNAIGWIGGGSNGWKITTVDPYNNDGWDYQSFNDPRDVYVDSSGYIYVADYSNNRISKWDSAGNAIGWIGSGSNGWKTSSASYGSNYQSFHHPAGVSLDSSGNIYVADSNNFRISKWDSSGNAIGWIGGGSDGWKTTNAPSANSDYQSFRDPVNLCVTSSGYIYVVDNWGHRICKWDFAGNAIGWVGGASNSWKTTDAPLYNEGSDYQSFEHPFDVFVTNSGYIYVADGANNHRVCKWKD